MPEDGLGPPTLKPARSGNRLSYPGASFWDPRGFNKTLQKVQSLISPHKHVSELGRPTWQMVPRNHKDWGKGSSPKEAMGAGKQEAEGSALLPSTCAHLLSPPPCTQEVVLELESEQRVGVSVQRGASGEG